MKIKNKENMYRLFRELSDVSGIAEMTVTCLNSFIESIRQLKCSREYCEKLYFELSETVRQAQPHIVPLMHLLDMFEKEMDVKLKSEMTVEEVGRVAIASLQDKIAKFKNNMARVTQNGLNYIDDYDVIIVHSPSAVVTNILVQAKEKMGKQFSVIILDHNPVRTRKTVQALRDARIDHIIAPAHNLSHYIEGANKMFVGALTITADRQIVAPTGTAGTVSLCHVNGIPVHLFANSLHYSHRNALDQEIYRSKEDTRSANLDFSIITHSHDLISLDLIDHIITEDGETMKKSA
ncbi:MAG: hypothetical protein KKE62_06580 [Proteobacteria bacterium]|nr:hypothetical protein [Pseudomonadota bacterium]MBU1386593.1 hypothetical protein [Pseudomonadota bacterium]MBU1542494.1 hypothetical protein [Pseudomonadota bacterium]MBU2483013.1 hypothetical protein [Pseudomonadota bacterium]